MLSLGNYNINVIYCTRTRVQRELQVNVVNEKLDFAAFYHFLFENSSAKIRQQIKHCDQSSYSQLLTVSKKIHTQMSV